MRVMRGRAEGLGRASTLPGPRSIPCPACDALPGRPCVIWRVHEKVRLYVTGNRKRLHQARSDAYHAGQEKT